MKPTLKFRWREEKHGYVIPTRYYENTDSIPVRTLQQWWEEEFHFDYCPAPGTVPDGEWRDVPIEIEA